MTLKAILHISCWLLPISFMTPIALCALDTHYRVGGRYTFLTQLHSLFFIFHLTSKIDVMATGLSQAQQAHSTHQCYVAGKTLLARAMAGEAGVPFFSAAGTEFDQVYVGIGAKKVRDVFRQARDAAPCILFIDEFDGIGQQRTASTSDGRRRTSCRLFTFFSSLCGCTRRRVTFCPFLFNLTCSPEAQGYLPKSWASSSSLCLAQWKSLLQWIYVSTREGKIEFWMDTADHALVLALEPDFARRICQYFECPADWDGRLWGQYGGDCDSGTNRPAVLDGALTRPGRFDRVIELALPLIDVSIAL